MSFDAYLEFFAVFQNFEIFMYSTIARGNPYDVLRVDGMVRRREYGTFME
jgi:hypothetical protein